MASANDISIRVNIDWEPLAEVLRKQGYLVLPREDLETIAQFLRANGYNVAKYREI